MAAITTLVLALITLALLVQFIVVTAHFKLYIHKTNHLLDATNARYAAYHKAAQHMYEYLYGRRIFSEGGFFQAPLTKREIGQIVTDALNHEFEGGQTRTVDVQAWPLEAKED